MVFSSSVFLFLFLPVVFLLYYVLPQRFRNSLLIVASLFFYAWGEPFYVLLMLASILINWSLSHAMVRLANIRGRKTVLALAVCINLSVLVIFKYSQFVVENFNVIFGTGFVVPNIILPVGISFFTFHALSYIIDVYRGQKAGSLPQVMLYISFFPQLIAGPIIRYHDIDTQIISRKSTPDEIVTGMRRFVIGLAKKILLANAMGQIADGVYALGGQHINMAVAWAGAIAYTLQIYFDFSGYSDMAVGLGHMFGFHIMENFNYPYIAQSIKDFWRRWHISLSTWFKEYLYIPLGGNRKGRVRTSVNMVIVFFCTGFWHGANWTFVIWGMLHGLFLILETLGIIKPKKIPRVGRHVYTLLVVVVGFALFRAVDVSQAWVVIRAMFTGIHASPAGMAALAQWFSPQRIFLLIAGLFACLPWVRWMKGWIPGARAARIVNQAGYALALVLLWICMIALSASTYNPFIYFRF